MNSDEKEFLLISEAVARLQAGMFGGRIKRPEPVKAAKKIYPGWSIGWELHKKKAAAALDAAIMAGDLIVNVFIPSSTDRMGRPLQVPIGVLERLLKSRGGLPDRPIRLPLTLLRENPVAPELFAALSNSAMFIQEAEFRVWYHRQKRRRRWPSQHESIKPRPGRPSKQTGELITSIRARVAQEEWSAPDGIAKLVRLLATHGAPNRNLVRRAVQRLYEATGDDRYRIVPRKRVRAKTGRSQT